MKLGIDVLLESKDLLNELRKKKVAFVGHPASVTANLTHSLNALVDSGVQVTLAYGPQHGMRGEKQDNMIESEDYQDPELKIPVLSLYGHTRRPPKESFDHFDICLFDLQDLGTRIYTFLTSLRYMMEACSENHKALWILDRPNPAGRPVEGLILESGWESFVGAGPLPMRHGLTLGEVAFWFKDLLKLDLDLKVVRMQDYQIEEAPFFGWPKELAWVNPSPNASSPHMAKTFVGTVMIEGTHLSEARGTTRPLEIVGAPDLDMFNVLTKMNQLKAEWLKGCHIRRCYFEPTFHKHAKNLCQGLQIHVDHPSYSHYEFKPYRLICLFLKSIRLLYPNYEIWRNFPYEYETDRLAFDIIHGGPKIRNWIDDKLSTPEDLEWILQTDEKKWLAEYSKYWLYK